MTANISFAAYNDKKTYNQSFIIKRKWWQLVWEMYFLQGHVWRENMSDITLKMICEKPQSTGAAFHLNVKWNTFHSNTCLKSHSGDKLTSALTHLPACYSDALCGNVTLLIILLQCMWWPSQLCIWGWHMEKEQINTLRFGFRETQNINQLKNEDTSITINPLPCYILWIYLFRHFISGFY